MQIREARRQDQLMFFGRIYARGKRFRPSWQSYATYTAVIAGLLLAVPGLKLQGAPMLATVIGREGHSAFRPPLCSACLTS